MDSFSQWLADASQLLGPSPPLSPFSLSFSLFLLHPLPFSISSLSLSSLPPFSSIFQHWIVDSVGSRVTPPPSFFLSLSVHFDGDLGHFLLGAKLLPHPHPLLLSLCRHFLMTGEAVSLSYSPSSSLSLYHRNTPFTVPSILSLLLNFLQVVVGVPQ